MSFEFPAGTIDWLLKHNLPTVRYQALRSIKGLPEGDDHVISARKEIMVSGPVPRILSKQGPQGWWGEEEHFYQRSKYKGTSWSIIALAELEADGGDHRIGRACDSILRCGQVRETGGFAYRGTSDRGGYASGTLPCLTSNMIWSLIRLGRSNDKAVKAGIDWLAKFQRFSSEPLVEDFPYRRERCWTPRDCRSAAVKCLRALTAVHPSQRSEDISRSIARGREYILDTCFGMNGVGLVASARKDWYDLGYPTMWNTDLLEIALVLKDAGAKDDQLEEVKETIIGLMDDKGRLTQRSPFNDRFSTRIEKFGEPSGLLTIRAYQLLS